MGSVSGGGIYIDGAYVLPARDGCAEVRKAFRYRLYPKPDQEVYFNKLFGCCRYVYNHFLEVRIRAWEAKQADPDVRIPTWVDMSRELTRMKREVVGKNGEHFLREVDATALVYELRHLDAAFASFFRRARAGNGRPGFPRFKGRHAKRSATIAFNKGDSIEANRIKFAKIGWVRANVHRPIEGRPVSATISQDASDRWWVSITCANVPESALPENDESIGLSLGGEPLIVDSNGGLIDFDVPDLSRDIEKARRRLARCEGPSKGRPSSKRYEKQRLRMAKLYAKEADQRSAQLNKLTSDLVGRYGVIVVRGRAPELVRQLRYKCEWAGRAYVELPGLKDEQLLTIEQRAEQAQQDLEFGLVLLEKIKTK